MERHWAASSLVGVRTRALDAAGVRGMWMTRSRMGNMKAAVCEARKSETREERRTIDRSYGRALVSWRCPNYHLGSCILTFPDPVTADAQMSLPARAGGMHCAWIEVGVT